MTVVVKKAVLNSFFQTTGAFAISGLNFLLAFGYTLILGEERFGALVTSQALVLVFTFFIELGLSNGLIGALTVADSRRKEGARQRFRARDIIKRVLSLRMLGACVGTMIVALYAFLNAQSKGDWSIFWQDIAFAPHLFALGLQQTANSYAIFRGRQGLAVSCIIVSTAITVMAPLYLAYNHAPIPLLLLSQCWGGFLSAALIYFYFMRNRRRIRTRRSKKKIRGRWRQDAWTALIRDAWPYAMVFAASVLWQRLDQLTVTNLLGLAAGGNYGFGVRLASIPILIATSISVALFPDFQRLGLDAPEKLAVYLGAISKFVYRWGILLVASIVMSVSLLIDPIYDKFDDAFRILPWFIPGIWAFWLQSFFVNGLYGLRHYKTVVLCHFTALLVYVLCLVPFTKLFGIVGVALAFSTFPVVLFITSYFAIKSSPRFVVRYSLISRYTSAEKEIINQVKDRLLHLLRLKRES